MGHKLGCLSLCSLQHDVNVSALQAHKKKKERKKNGQENRKQNIFFCFLIFTEHLNTTSEPNTKGKLAVSVNDTLFVEHTRATPPNTKQRYKVVIKAKTFLTRRRHWKLGVDTRHSPPDCLYLYVFKFVSSCGTNRFPFFFKLLDATAGYVCDRRPCSRPSRRL